MNCIKCDTPLNKEIASCPKCGTVAITASATVEARLKQAHRMREMQMYNKAIALYLGLLEEEGITDHASIYEQIGEAYFESGNAVQAIIAFEKAFALKPTDDLQQKLFDAKQATAAPIIKKTIPKPEKVVPKKVPVAPDINKTTSAGNQKNPLDFQDIWQSLMAPDRIKQVTILAIVIMVISLTTLVRPWEWFMPKKSLLISPPRLHSPSSTHQKR
jgi:tetratricopeptide (TPR) repeat protein